MIQLLAQAATTAPVALSDIQAYYAPLRVPIITGSFAVAALCASINSFVFAKVKESVYDSDEYAVLVQQRRFFNASYTTHGALMRFFRIIWSTVGFAVLNIAANFTLGAMRQDWAVVTCVGLTVVMGLMLIVVIYATWQNVHAWIRWSSMKTERRIAASTNTPRAA